jgi:hypothetical protein
MSVFVYFITYLAAGIIKLIVEDIISKREGPAVFIFALLKS